MGLVNYNFAQKKMRTNKNHQIRPLPQDLHIHTTFSVGDSAVVKEQTLEFIHHFRHADLIGISDHFDRLADNYEKYRYEVKKYGFRLGTEINYSDLVNDAINLDFEYFIYHCENRKSEYNAVEKLLATGKPIIIAHPMALETNLNRIPKECFVEINNRYVWRNNWQQIYAQFKNKFRFVISSDAHQPNWLNQHIARQVAQKLQITESIIFNRHPQELATEKAAHV
jgi:histidinol phosphatase-like PHP family hydrolase